MSVAPLVSVVIPAYDAAAYLAAAIESVLGQTYRRLEVIVVDDGSSDGTADVARAFAERVRYLRQPHLGPGAARNRGVGEARGALLAFQDADDEWIETKLERQVAALADPAVDMVFGHMEEFLSDDLSESERRRIESRPGPRPGYMVQAMLIRREAFARVGEFEPTWRVGEFVDWYTKALERGLRAVMLPDVVARRRLHGDNLGLRERAARGDYVRILKRAVDRRRAARPREADPSGSGAA